MSKEVRVIIRCDKCRAGPDTHDVEEGIYLGFGDTRRELDLCSHCTRELSMVLDPWIEVARPERQAIAAVQERPELPCPECANLGLSRTFKGLSGLGRHRTTKHPGLGRRAAGQTEKGEQEYDR